MKNIKGIVIEIGGNTQPLEDSLKDVRALGSQLNSELKRTQSLIKLDSKDINLWKNKQDLLNKSIENTNARLYRLQQGQKAAAEALSSGKITQEQYNQIGKEIASAEYLLARFNKELANTNSKIQNIQVSKLQDLNNKLNTLKNSLQGLARYAQMALAATSALIYSGVRQGDQLDDLSHKYGTTAEQIQIQRNLYAKAAEGAEGYEQSLSAISSMLKSVERGSTKYDATLIKLGLSSEALKGKTTAEAYELIYQALRNVNNESERAVMANALLGESGLNLAVIAGLTNEEIEAYNKRLIETGIITSEQAAKAGQLADKYDDIKQKTSIAGITLMEKLMPALIVVSNVILNLNDFIGNLSEKKIKVLMIILILVAVLPKFIAIMQTVVGVVKLLTVATYGQAAATGALTAAGLPLWITLAAIAAIIITIIFLFTSLSKKTKDATSDLTDMTSKLNGLNGFNADIKAQNNAISTSNSYNKEEINVNVKVDFKGDTPISSSNAKQIASYIEPAVVDAVNKKLLLARASRGGL